MAVRNSPDGGTIRDHTPSSDGAVSFETGVSDG
jgi:hypothetical protein